MNDTPPEGTRNININIEELVLEGFPDQHKNLIAISVQQELQRLITQHIPAALTRNISIKQLIGNQMEVEPGSTPAATGIRIARSLYGGIR
jgi:hypothetical protein